MKLDVDKIVDLWDIHKSNRKVAKIIEVDEKTIRNYLKKVGIVSPKGNNKGITKKKWSKFWKWCKEHPNEILPRDYERIQEMTGVSRDTIKCFFYRRKLRMKERKLSRKQKLMAENGHIINMRYVDRYEIKADEKSGLYRITAYLGSLPIYIQAKEEDLVWEK